MTQVWSSTGDALSDFTSHDAAWSVVASGKRPSRFKVADGSGVGEARKTLPSPLTAYGVRWYAELGSTTPGPAMARGYGDVGQAIWRVDFNSSGFLRLIPNGPGVAWASDVPLPLGKELRYEVTVDSAGNGTLSVFDGDGANPIMSGAGPVGAGTMYQTGFGRTTSATSAASTGLFMDDLAVTDTPQPIGPPSGAAPVTTNPVLSRIESDGSLTPYEITTL